MQMSNPTYNKMLIMKKSSLDDLISAYYFCCTELECFSNSTNYLHKVPQVIRVDKIHDAYIQNLQL